MYQFQQVLNEAPSTLVHRNLKTQLYFLRVKPIIPTLLCQENRTFQKHSSNQRNFKMPAVRFSVNGKHFEKKAFQK